MDFPARTLPELFSFLESQSEPHIVMDANYRIIAANRPYIETYAQCASLVGHHCYEVSHHFTSPCD